MDALVDIEYLTLNPHFTENTFLSNSNTFWSIALSYIKTHKIKSLHNIEMSKWIGNLLWHLTLFFFFNSLFSQNWQHLESSSHIKRLSWCKTTFNLQYTVSLSKKMFHTKISKLIILTSHYSNFPNAQQKPKYFKHFV